MIPKKMLALSYWLLAGIVGLEAQGRSELLKRFAFQDHEYRLQALFSPGRADLVLGGQGERNLSAAMAGENILLGTRAGRDNFYVFWLNYQKGSLHLACYDHDLDASRELPLSGFSFFGAPEIVEREGGLRGLVFLGNRSDNDDVFYYDIEKDLLAPLTATPFSEKGFTLLDRDGHLEIESESLWARYVYRFDPEQGQSLLLSEEPFAAARAAGAAAPAYAYYNTFVGFGDSVTWGKIDGIQQIELCFLTQMRDRLADPSYAFYYGASIPVNLGVPGDTTAMGAKRVKQDLDLHPGLYFLLMLGLNDAIDMNMSLASSLESLGYIIDAAQARGMRVVVSTPTPSKSTFSAYEYFWKNLIDLSGGILELARQKAVVSIDSYSAFMTTNPPNGWKSLLEEVSSTGGSGNHPNQAGHALIASLFAPALVKFPPMAPQDVAVLDPQDPQQRKVSWAPCYESDFDHFRVEFGFQPQKLNHALETGVAYHTFTLFPFLPQFFFRVQAIDRGDRGSAFSATNAEATVDRKPEGLHAPRARLAVRKDE
jgi:lysophospholipase L1-like esterase